jgi:hypothetical protein
VAMDLWKRWSLDKLRNVVKPKTATQANEQARIVAAAAHTEAVKNFKKPKAAAKAAART